MGHQSINGVTRVDRKQIGIVNTSRGLYLDIESHAFDSDRPIGLALPSVGEACKPRLRSGSSGGDSRQNKHWEKLRFIPVTQRCQEQSG